MADHRTVGFGLLRGLYITGTDITINRTEVVPELTVEIEESGSLEVELSE